MNAMYDYNDELLIHLKEIIISNLLPLIDDDYSLLDVPNHNNIGDSLILGGEYEFLKQSPFQLLYKSSVEHGRDEDIPRDGILLMHGGGNFGDIWFGPNKFRRKIISERRDQKIIIFPQTVHYEDVQAVLEDVKIYSKHPDLTICARDQKSFSFLKDFFSCNNILLIPDMAFVLGPVSCNNLRGVEEKGNLLFLNRTDKELNTQSDYLKIIKDRFPTNDIHITDWPLLNPKGIVAEKVYWKLHDLKKSLSKNIERTIFRRFLIDDCYGLGRRNKHLRLIDSGIELFSDYEVIYTNRLHGLILGLLLGKVVYCFDNNYGKNSQFYDTWLKASEKSEFILNSST